MKNGFLAFLVNLAIVSIFSTSAFAVDDGARAYWKGRDGTHGFSFQYLNLNMQASGAQQFDPAHFIYSNTDVSANIMIANYMHFTTLFNRPSSLAVTVVGGSVDANISASASPLFVPPTQTPGVAFNQSASGYGDPAVQLDINLYGTPPLKANFDLLDYEPTLTIDTALMVGLPIGSYDENKLVNLGLNRWYGRIALPAKYHFGVFSRGNMSSFELTPSVWLFADNDNFLGQNLKNDPMWQVEAHLTHDFTRSLWGSLDVLYRTGFKSEIDGVAVGDAIKIGDVGFTLSYQATDNLAIRTGFSSNVFGDKNLESSLIRMQFVYSWHRDMENMKKLMSGH
jgi:hypothetical protein